MLWVACTHGDVIKSVIADAYGIHLDGFQRVTADPGVGECDPLHPAAAVRVARQPHRCAAVGRVAGSIPDKSPAETEPKAEANGDQPG